MLPFTGLPQGRQVTSLLPYPRMTVYRGTGQAVVPTDGLLLHKKFFPEMLHRMPWESPEVELGALM